jgi:hypothetical protein
MRDYSHILCALLLTSLLGACGGGGSDRSPRADPDPVAAPDPTPTPEPPPGPVMISGQFKDANVSGLSFESGTHTGITDALGSFSCNSDQRISFAVGAVALGSSDCAEVVTPVSLIANGTPHAPAVVNIARFLQMLDSNGDPGDGIEVSDAVQMRAASWPAVDFAAPDLNVELRSIVDDLAAQGGYPLPDASEARDHLLQSLQCVHAGVYWLQLRPRRSSFFYGGLLAILPREVDGAQLVGIGLASDDVVRILAPIAGTSFGHPPSLAFTDEGGAHAFDARLVAPGRLEGRWNTDGQIGGSRTGSTAEARHRFVAYSETDGGATAWTLELGEQGLATATQSSMGWWDEGYDATYEGAVNGSRVDLTNTDGWVGPLTAEVDLAARPPTATITRVDNDSGTTDTYTLHGCRLN